MWDISKTGKDRCETFQAGGKGHTRFAFNICPVGGESNVICTTSMDRQVGALSFLLNRFVFLFRWGRISALLQGIRIFIPCELMSYIYHFAQFELVWHCVNLLFFFFVHCTVVICFMFCSNLLLTYKALSIV